MTLQGAMLAFLFALSATASASESTTSCQELGSCSSDTAGLAMLQFRQASAKTVTEAEVFEDDEEDEDEKDDDDDDYENGDNEDEDGGKEDEDETDDDDDKDGDEDDNGAEEGGKGDGDKIKPHVKACVDKAAEDACSFNGKDGEAKEGTCADKDGTLRCKSSGGKSPGGRPGKGGKGGKFGRLVKACVDKAAEDACSFKGKEGEAKEGTCADKKGTLWCKSSGGKSPGGRPGKGGKEDGDDEEEKEEEDEKDEGEEEEEEEEQDEEDEGEDEEEEKPHRPE